MYLYYEERRRIVYSNQIEHVIDNWLMFRQWLCRSLYPHTQYQAEIAASKLARTGFRFMLDIYCHFQNKLSFEKMQSFQSSK